MTLTASPSHLVGMGEVVALDEVRRRRVERALAAAAVHAPMHPALRWATFGGAVAHRRTPDGMTVCGQSGPLLIADPGLVECRDCYPARLRA